MTFCSEISADLSERGSIFRELCIKSAKYPMFYYNGEVAFEMLQEIEDDVASAVIAGMDWGTARKASSSKTASTLLRVSSTDLPQISMRLIID